MFVFGGLPALMMAFIRYGVHESKKWQEKFGEAAAQASDDGAGVRRAVHAEVQARHLVMSGLFLVSIVMLWAGSIYVPTAATQLATRLEARQLMRLDALRIRATCWRSARSSGASWCRSWLNRSVAACRWRSS